MTRERAMHEIRAAIAYYTAHGWDWLDVVGFIYSKVQR